jgi:hypothetical protein
MADTQELITALRKPHPTMRHLRNRRNCRHLSVPAFAGSRHETPVGVRGGMAVVVALRLLAILWGWQLPIFRLP